MYRPQQLLSENRKTNISINLPIKGHCTPTPNCRLDCYARYGPIAAPNSTRKQKFLSNYLKGKKINQLILECKQYIAVRISGCRDLLPDHVSSILSLAQCCPMTQFWGMTPKPNIATALNDQLPNLRLLVTVDASSPIWIWKYSGKLCYGPRRQEDPIPDDGRIITIFPKHSKGKIVGKVPHHSKDCPAVRHTVKGCIDCGRCWNWNKEVNIPVVRKIHWK